MIHFIADLALKFYVALSVFILVPMCLGIFAWYIADCRRDRKRKMNELYREREERKTQKELDLFETKEDRQ